MCTAPRPGLVFAGGHVQPTPRLRARLAVLAHPYVVAADVGAVSALAFGYIPDRVIGDFDSLPESIARSLEAQSVHIESYPRDKSDTDGALAVAHVVAAGCTPIVLVGFLGGARLDHALANVLLLLDLPFGTVLLDEHNECRLLRSGESLDWYPEPGELVSLLPLGSDAVGVSAQGLRWPLAHATLRLGATRGVSNEPLGGPAQVSLGQGQLLVTRHFPAM